MKNDLLLEALDFIDPTLLDDAYLTLAESAAKKTHKTHRRVFYSTGIIAASALLFVSVLLIWNRPGAGLVDPISGSDPVAASTLAFDPVPVSDAARPDALDVVYLPGLALPGASTETVQFAGLSVSEPLYEALTENRNQYYCIRVDGADASDVETFRDAGVFFEVVNDTLYIYPTEEQLETLNGISGTLGESCTLSLSTDPVIGEAWEKYVVQRQFGENPYIYSRLDFFVTSSSFGNIIWNPKHFGQFLDLLPLLEQYIVCPIAISEEDSLKAISGINGSHDGFFIGDEETGPLLSVSLGPDYIIIRTGSTPVYSPEGYFTGLQYTHSAEFQINTDPKPLVDALKAIPSEQGYPRIPAKYQDQCY